MFVLIFEYIEVGILQSLDLGRISILYSKMRHYWLRSILKEHYFPQFFPFFLNYCEANSNCTFFFITPVYKVKFYSESAAVEIFHRACINCRCRGDFGTEILAIHLNIYVNTNNVVLHSSMKRCTQFQ